MGDERRGSPDGLTRTAYSEGTTAASTGARRKGMSGMDPLDRADALLHRAQARGAYVVTPESAISPMDASNTQQIPREVVRGADARIVDPDATTIVTDDEIREQDEHHLAEAAPTTTLEPRKSAEAFEVEDDEVEEEVEEELDGFLPTTTKRMKPKLVSRRLEG